MESLSSQVTLSGSRFIHEYSLDLYANSNYLDSMEFGKIAELMCSEQISKMAALVSRSINRPRTTYYRRAVSMCKCKCLP